MPCAATAATSAFSVAVTLGSSRKTSAPLRPEARSSILSVAELLEGEEMGVEPAAADDVAPGRRQRHFAAAGEQGAGQQDRGADANAEIRIEIGGADLLGVDREPVAAAPFGGGADRADQFDQGLGVTDARHVVERDGVLGQQRCGDDRQRGVLVARRLDRALEPVAALDDVLNGRHARRVRSQRVVCQGGGWPQRNLDRGRK